MLTTNSDLYTIKTLNKKSLEFNCFVDLRHYTYRISFPFHLLSARNNHGSRPEFEGFMDLIKMEPSSICPGDWLVWLSTMPLILTHVISLSKISFSFQKAECSILGCIYHNLKSINKMMGIQVLSNIEYCE